MTHAPDISSADMGWRDKDDIIAEQRDQLYAAARSMESLADENNRLRAEVRRLTTAMGLPPVGWLPQRKGVRK